MISKEQISTTVRLLQEARRPLFIWGSGMRSCASSALALARSLGVPVACTWGAIDLMHHDDPLMAGGFGTHGTRAANFAVQNSDLIVSIGSRLDTKATGMPAQFARAARLVMVDIDSAEIHKFAKLGRTIDVGICADAGEFIDAITPGYGKLFIANDGTEWKDWAWKIIEWRKRYDTPAVTWPGINPYELVKEIGKYTTSEEDIICSDTGTALGYLMQSFPFKGERFLHAFNMTPMGYGLPAAIGASFATGKRVVLVTGDGSSMMSLAELATLSRWSLNIKIILLNNKQHSMCVQTEHQWFGGRHASTTIESGLSFPKDWYKVARSFGIDTYEEAWNNSHSMYWLRENDDPAFVCVDIHKDAKIIPQARYGQPLEDADPQLPRDEFRAQMIVEPL